MAKAKKIRRQTDRLAKQKLKKSGELKGLSRKEKKRKIYVGGLQERNKIRKFLSDENRLKIEQSQKEADIRRNEARAKGQKLVYDVPTTPSFSSVTPPAASLNKMNKGKKQQQSKDQTRTTQKNNERIRQNQQARRDASAKGDAYKVTMQDGSIKNVLARKPGESDADFKKRFAEMRKTKSAKHGGALAIMIAPVKSKKMKAVKKAPGGGAMKKMQTYKKGGALKAVPSDAKGLSKLPKEVRNKMGYAKHGGKLKDKMMYGGSMKKAMYGAKMKKKAMYGAKMKKKAMYGAKMKK